MKSILLSFSLLASSVCLSQTKSDTTQKSTDTSKIAAPIVNGLQPNETTALFTLADINELYLYLRRSFTYDQAEPLVNWIQRLTATRSEEWRKAQVKQSDNNKKKKGEQKKE